MGHLTSKPWQVVGGEPSLKMSAPKLFRFGSEGVLKIFSQKITEVISRMQNEWDNVWKSQGGIMVNGVPRELPRSKPEGSQAPRFFFAAELSEGLHSP